MSFTYTILIYIHVTIGFASLILFWIPVAVRKGSKLHSRWGNWYARAMYLVGGTAFVLSWLLILDPISTKYAGQQLNPEQIDRAIIRANAFGAFLLAISVLVIANVRHGLLTIKSKQDHVLMRAPSHLLLNGVLIIVGLYLASIAKQMPSTTTLFYVFAGICIVSGVGQLRYSLKTEVPPMEWMVAHLSAMIGAGIGTHTAFFVFGGSRFVAELLSGQWMLIPWVGPGVVGSLAIGWLARKYRNKYRKVRAKWDASRESTYLAVSSR